MSFRTLLVMCWPVALACALWGCQPKRPTPAQAVDQIFGYASVRKREKRLKYLVQDLIKQGDEQALADVMGEVARREGAAPAEWVLNGLDQIDGAPGPSVCAYYGGQSGDRLTAHYGGKVPADSTAGRCLVRTP